MTLEIGCGGFLEWGSFRLHLCVVKAKHPYPNPMSRSNVLRTQVRSNPIESDSILVKPGPILLKPILNVENPNPKRNPIQTVEDPNPKETKSNSIENRSTPFESRSEKPDPTLEKPDPVPRKHCNNLDPTVNVLARR